MEIYEVELRQRGRWEQQHARFVAARDADESDLQGDRRASSQRRGPQECAVAREEARKRQPPTKVVLRRLIRSLVADNSRRENIGCLADAFL